MSRADDETNDIKLDILADTMVNELRVQDEGWDVPLDVMFHMLKMLQSLCYMQVRAGLVFVIPKVAKVELKFMRAQSAHWRRFNGQWRWVARRHLRLVVKVMPTRSLKRKVLS